jgi:hypothetical protein
MSDLSPLCVVKTIAVAVAVSIAEGAALCCGRAFSAVQQRKN